MLLWIVLGTVVVASGSGVLLMQQKQESFDIMADFKEIKSAVAAFRKENKGLSKGIENIKPFMPKDSMVKLERYQLSMDDKFLVIKKMPKGADPQSIVSKVGGDSKYSDNVLKLSFYASSMGPEPQAVIDISPLKNLTTTSKIEYSHNNSTAENNEIIKVEWKNNQEYFDEDGVQNIKLRIMDKHFRWSEWATKEIFISEEKGVKSIHGFGGHIMIVHKNGHVHAYGENDFGQLGNCTNQNNVKVEKLVQIDKVETISTGKEHTLFLKTDKTVYGTGRNNFGQLGIGSRLDSKIPKLTWGIDNIISIAAGDSFSAAVTVEGDLFTWGRNEDQCLAQGEEHFLDRPMRVKGVSNVTSVALGNNFALALHHDGTVTAWGDNDSGELALGFKNKHNEPTVTLLKDVDQLIAGTNYAYAITKQKKVMAFGSNKNSQLGFEGEREALFPKEIPGLKDIVKIATHQNYTVALDERGNVFSWGQFFSMDLDYEILPFKSNELKYVQDIAVSNRYGYALMEDGIVYEFGSKFSSMRKLEFARVRTEDES